MLNLQPNPQKMVKSNPDQGHHYSECGIFSEGEIEVLPRHPL